MKLPFFLARRFVAAENLAGTLPVARKLQDSGLHFTLDLLGEYIKDRAVATQACEAYLDVIHTLAAEHDKQAIDKNISIKLSMIGQKIDEAFCLDNLYRLMEAAHQHDVFIRLDMEGSDITDSTLAAFEKVYPDYPDHIGIVLQAYLHRTSEDIDRMCALNARVRLCKGAYKEHAGVAYQDMPTIRERYLDYMQRLITHARYPGIATHDDLLISATKTFVTEQDIPVDRFEFQMLYGLRPETQIALVQEGYNMRVYIPFGERWLPYFTRRLRERKENVWFVLNTMLRK